ncbi:hypothetical protein ACHABX_13535 [Nesterenkonia halotolerans]|uniref:hypothetical protein n=1 Tax=Nesterenkonia halotolerans TaxID=225325 RepID=UPI003EE7C0FA
MRTIDYVKLSLLAEVTGEAKSAILNRALVEYLERATHPHKAAQEETVMARPSKGDRVGVTTKVPRGYFEKLDRLTRATGETKVDYIAALVIKDLDTIDIQAVEEMRPSQLRREAGEKRTR